MPFGGGNGGTAARLIERPTRPRVALVFVEYECRRKENGPSGIYVTGVYTPLSIKIPG